MKNYFSLVKFSHTIFAMPFAILGFFMALNLNELNFNYLILIYVVLCMVFARNAAMGFNRYLDRSIDAKNPRTLTRDIPAGKISSRNALIFVVINVILFMVTTWFINELCFFLSPVALIVVLGYSFTKRFTSLCHFVLGLGLALAPIGAYIAVTGSFNHFSPVLLSFGVLFWTAGFDIIYALQDVNFDRENQLKSVPERIGVDKALILSRLLHLVSILFVLTAGWMMTANLLYWIASGIFSLLLLNQHRLVKPNDFSKINIAFFTMNGIASLIFGTMAILSFYFLR